jgi:cell wall-associated NlpC family hydrolase
LKNRVASLFLIAALATGVVAGFATPAAEAQSLGDKIKGIFEPTPPPKKRKSSSSSAKKKSSATPTPSPKPKASPSATPKSSPAPKPTSSPSPSASPTQSPTPTTSPSPSGKSSKKKKASPSPSPSVTPTPSPDQTASPSPTASPPASPSPGESPAGSPSPEEKKDRPGGVTIAPNELKDFESYPPAVKKLVESSLALAGRNLSYKYGSADPANGGFDCSGFIYYVLRENGFTEVPRDSSQQYVWVRKSGSFQAVVSKSDESFELEALRPGDLMFWSGTYDINRDPPITHSMIYLGREKSTGRRVMVGASDGRVYRDQSRFGVSVFDFKVSRTRPATNGRTPDFVGYGRIPGLGEG